jgi:hypothetical protein
MNGKSNLPIAYLPDSLKPSGYKDLLRLGRQLDGGYIVSKHDINNCDLLMSFGIYDDWSFEEAFQNITNVPVYAYDGSVSTKLFLKLAYKAFFGFTGRKSTFHWLRTALKFYLFYSRKNIHKSLFVSPIGPNNISFNDAINATNHNLIYLKIDIEGGEYRILDSIIENRDRIVGLVIEFHDVDLHIEKILNFTRNLKMNIVHVHANNSAGISGFDNIPVVLEITYGTSIPQSIFPALPNFLDCPNDPALEDIKIVFKQ